ncbi:MAG: Ig-like domain-containing protein, partial [Verrucomicrobia bacterium]|nr:Ig-like domain-containing protein [Verrucomicrobiota bacterium]
VVRLVDPRVKLGNYTTSLTNGILTVKGDDAPVVTLTNSPWPYTVGTAAALVDTNATVTDGGSPNFDGGTLTVWASANGNALDTLSYLVEGEIGQDGTGVTYGGALIATVAGGTGTTPLVFSLNTNATPAAVESTNSRTIRVVVADGDGGISAPVTKVLALNRPPVAGPDSYSVAVNGTLTNTIASVIANDTDADGDTVVLESFSGVSANGGRIIQEGTNLIYRAPVGYHGVDLFAYLIADGRGGEAVGVMTLRW